MQLVCPNRFTLGFAVLFGACSLQAQETTSPSRSDFPLGTPLAATESEYVPLSDRGKVDYFYKSLTSPQTVTRQLLMSGVRQWQNNPDEWPQGSAGFGRRIGARYGEFAIRRGLQLGINVLHNEDPRFARSERAGVWPRMLFVLKRTVIARSDDGGETIALGRLGSAYGSALIANRWMPDGRNSHLDAVRRGTMVIGGDVAMRMLREFWPDIKRTFRK